MISNQPSTALSRLVHHMAGARIVSTRIFAYILAGFLLVTDHTWPKGGFVETALSALGLVCAGAGAFGRVWASLYIAGYKDSSLVTEGPYSTVRNPLYLFSFIGAFGLACGTGSLLLICLLLAAFLLYYPVTVISEEKNLRTLHGDEYNEYAAKTPRFFPKFSLYRESETYLVKTRDFQRALLDAVWFVWLFALVRLIGALHTSGWLPNWILIP